MNPEAPRSLSIRRGENLVGMIKEKGQKTFEGSSLSLRQNW